LDREQEDHRRKQRDMEELEQWRREEYRHDRELPPPLPRTREGASRAEGRRSAKPVHPGLRQYSSFWKNLHQIKDLFKIGARHEVHNGQQTQFWYDRLAEGGGVLRERFPLIFCICENQRISVAQVCEGQGHLRLRRTLDGQGRAEWEQLHALLDNTHLLHGHDKVSWPLDPSRVYTVSSMYNALSHGASVAYFRDM
jgi:hypothetical protein